MSRITEHTIEAFAIELLEDLGYRYIYAPDIAPDSDNPLRENFEQVLLMDALETAVRRINPDISLPVQAEALKEIQRIASPDLLTNNETFHRFLTEGIPVTKRVGSDERGDLLWLIDFDNPLNNDFVVANQFTVIENGVNKRPDVLLFVNGIPLVVMELKNASDENTTVRSAFRQIETYKSAIPTLFTYNGLVVISDGLEAKAGSISAGFSRYMAWKTVDGKIEASHLTSQLETLVLGMLNPATLLDLIRHFIVFEKMKREDAETAITTIETVKKMAAYHQYYAVNRAVESTLRAVDIHSIPHYNHPALAVIPPQEANLVKESPESYLPAPPPGIYCVYAILCDNDSIYIGQTSDLRKRWKEHLAGVASAHTKKFKPIKIVHYETVNSRREAVQLEKEWKTGYGRKRIKRLIESGRARQAGGLPGVVKQPSGDRKAGVVWHTQGSGKSLSMVFYTGKIVLVLDNPTILVITDRNDLDDQLFDTFAASKQLLRQEPVQAEDRNHLKELLKVASGGVVFTTIQKFQPDPPAPGSTHAGEGNVYELLSNRKNIVVIADEAHRTQYGFKAKTIDAKDEKGNIIGKRIVYVLQFPDHQKKQKSLPLL